MASIHVGWRSSGPPPPMPVNLVPDGLIAHTAILAQSGSGKSFALGRLIEEILLATTAKIIVLDPNSDFLRLSEIEESRWEDIRLKDRFAQHDTALRFKRAWRSVGIAILTTRKPSDLDLKSSTATVAPFLIDWSELTKFEKAQYLGYTPGRDPLEFMTVTLAELVAEAARRNYTLFGFQRALRNMREAVINPGGKDSLPEQVDKSWLSEAALSRVYVSVEGIRSLQIWKRQINTPSEQLLEHKVEDFLSPETTDRALVVDLPSLQQKSAQLVVANRILELLWEGVRKQWAQASVSRQKAERVPLFVVVDEAHNLAPDSSTDENVRAVTEKLAQMAAEERKYGIFLIVSSQRASKVHGDILSQCDNLWLMKTNNRSDLNLIEDTFGFLPADRASSAQTYSRGQALLAGSFVDQPVEVWVAPRRTVEGGGNLRSEDFML